MSPTLRFAPSPTGRLHLGNARTALVNWLYARRHGGRLLLRLDDTDRERSTAAFAAAIAGDLRWLGLDWDDSFCQSDRGAAYTAAFERLRVAGRAYPAYETAEELAAQRAARRARGLPPRYDRSALALTAAERAAFDAAGRRPHWRLRLSGRAVAWTDLVQGAVRIETASLSDPVLLRADGAATYTLASVVDDIDFAVGPIIRGDDHRTNTAVQIELFEALDAAVPRFAHLPLILGEGGAPLSKRSGDWSLADWRERGIEPHAIRLYLAALGTDRAAEADTDVDRLVAELDLARFGKGSAVFAADQLWRLSRALFQARDLSGLRSLDGLADLAAEEWAALRANVASPDELRGWLRVLREPLVPVVDEPALARAAAELLPADLADAAAAAAWLTAVQQATGRKGKALFHPLRLALTGRADGPKLADLLPLLGRTRALRRLLGETA